MRSVLVYIEFQVSHRSEQMEGSVGTGADREIGEERTVAAGREARLDDSIKFWVQKVCTAVELYVVMLAAFESSCCGYKLEITVFCQLSMVMTVILPTTKCLCDKY